MREKFPRPYWPVWVVDEMFRILDYTWNTGPELQLSPDDHRRSSLMQDRWTA